jgi:hypothetical protein
LASYRPADAFLLKPGRATGVPGLLEGTSGDGNPVLIRVWPRGANVDDGDLVDIWRNELRVLHRLGGSPGAEEYIGRLVDAGQDDRGFYIVIGAGQRRPVENLLDPSRRGTEWLRSMTAPNKRRQLWENLRRIALALEILHSQGLLHCNLDAWSVLTAGGADLDFQLTGFEWSMRLLGSASNRASKTSGAAVSFLDDWAAFAKLCARLLNVRIERVLDLKNASHAVAEHTSADEIALLRELLYPASLTQLDGDFVVERIDRIVSALEAAAAADEAQYYVILGLGRDSSLSRAIREASGSTVEMDDIEGQREFVRADLSSEPRVIATRAGDTLRLFLRGSELIYRIRQYRIGQSPTPSWEFAACENADLAEAWHGSTIATCPIAFSSLSIMTFYEARERVPRLRGRTLNWERIISDIEGGKPSKPNKEERTRRAFTLLHALDLIFASAEVFPVRAVSEKAESDAEPRLRLKLVEDGERNELAKALGLRSMQSRLQDLLDRDAVADDEGWLFTEARALGSRTRNDIDLQYESTAPSEGAPAFVFRVTSQTLGAPPPEGLLIPGEFRGRIAQFQRRARALRGLREHIELLRMLADPRSRLVETHETVQADQYLDRLDAAKQGALQDLFGILPLYLLQGPPGVGKTFLVREVVRRRFSDEPAARILLTAQSHHSVDHLVTELQQDWQTQSQQHPLAVRCSGSETADAPTALDLGSQTRMLANRLATSNLARSSSPRLIEALKSAVGGQQAGREAASRAEIRALEGLVMRAANLVFATTNSADLERLVDEKGQFDWAIVEEAGKATGIELLMPLLLSHRRLMIGDHKQLPPFGAEKAGELLNDPERLRIALRLGLELTERSLRDVVSDELTEMIDDDDAEAEFGQLCADAKRMLFLFETLIEDEAARQAKSGARPPNIARVLTIQHRMHPVIAGLVSRCFYDGAIGTGKEAAAKFSSALSPIISRDDKRLPDTPIVIVDMPYQQSTIGGKDVERYPRFTNPGEVQAVRDIVQLLQPSTADRRPSLAVLSPYAKQVMRIRMELMEDDNCRSALARFKPVARGDAWCSTVDAFQGNEADAIIVSLVRNNHHATLRRALGFISDPRRMNVLLSRARWRLYLVTSLEFLRTVATPLGMEKEPEANYLREFLAGLDDCLAQGTATRIVPGQLGGPMP